MSQKSPKSPLEIRHLLTGPVASTPTIFHRDGSIDFAGLRNFIDFVIAGGTTTILLTYGDSLYSILTDQEVAEVTRVAVEHTAGRALVVAADRIWATPKELEFADYVRELGADLLMVLPPDWGASCTKETFVEHYAAVAARVPVMVVTNVFMGRQALGLEVLKTLHDTVPGVVAVKDDVVGSFARKMAIQVRGRWSVVSGGLKQNHLDLKHYGVDGYLSTFIKFKPQVTQEYMDALKVQDWAGVFRVIRDYEIPYFDYISSLPGSFDAGVHGSMELFGVAGRWRRKPYHSLTDAEMEQLADLFARLGLR